MAPLHILLSALFLTIGLSGHAQDVIDAIAVESCSCIKELDQSSLTGEALQMQLGLCMMRSAAPYEKELRKKYKVDMARLDHATGEKLGELVGVRLVMVCPEFVEMLPALTGEEVEDPATASTESAAGQVTGVVTGLRDRQFSTVLVKDINGRTVELLRLDHFAGADLLNGATATGVKATFSYVVRELYDPVAGTYRAHNVLVGLEAE